jgi:dihydroflavonol-4-reductase
MKTLVTGATGFVGSAVLRKLIAAGHEVRVLARHTSDPRNLAGLDVEMIEGDLTDADSLRRAVTGCNRLFHVAADYRLWIPNPDAMYQTNVVGTVNLLRHAAAAGVERIVYTSSVAALGLTADGSPANETTPVQPDKIVGHYKRSKYQAEQAVLKLVAAEKLPVVIVNPSTPVGPRDIKPTPTGRIIIDTLNRRMPAYVDTGLNIVHVDDVATGHVLACERGEIGERYILGGENMTLKAILEEISDNAGLKPPSIRLPHDLVLPVAWCMERWAAISGREPRATVDGVRMAKKKMYFSSEKARRQLGYRYRPARDGLADAIRWFRDNGYCKA